MSLGAFVALMIIGATLRLLASREPDPDKLIIHYARYGVGAWPWQYKNVTHAVRGLVKKHALDILPLNEFGDPFPNKAKRFTVKYSYGGITREISKGDGHQIVLPVPDYANLEQQPRQINDAHNGLRVTSAIWRCVDDPTIFNEVTGTANSLITEAKSLTAKPENRVFGDPCNKHKPFVKGHHKNLELTYVFQGNKLLSEYDEPHTLSLIEQWKPANIPQAVNQAVTAEPSKELELQRELTELKIQLTSTSPFIVPVNFGSQDKPERRGTYPGFLLSNDGKSIAYDISMLPFRIGKWKVELDQVLRLEVGKTTPTWISMRHENTGNADLRSHLVEVQQATGTLGDPVPFRIVYRDSNQNWFVSLFELAIGLHGVEVKCLKHESHTMPTPGPSSATDGR